MDSGRMDARGGRAARRNKRACKLALTVLQSLLVVACLLLTLSVYWRKAEEPSAEDIVHIRFKTIGDIRFSGTLKFKNVRSSHQMDLIGKNDVIRVQCTGPYVLYMYVCYMGLRGMPGTGYLELRVTGQETPAASIHLTTNGSAVSQGLQRTFYLKAWDQASLHLKVTGSFKLKTASVGLSSLLGSQCDY